MKYNDDGAYDSSEHVVMLTLLVLDTPLPMSVSYNTEVILFMSVMLCYGYTVSLYLLVVA